VTFARYRYSIFVTTLAVLLSGCEMKQKILDLNAVSMTSENLKDGEALKETGPVSNRFCADSFHDQGQIGILDRLIQITQEEESADYLTKVSFYRTGKTCFLLEGIGNTIVAAAPKPSEVIPRPKAKKH